MQQNAILLVEMLMISIMVYDMVLRKSLNPMLISATYFWSQDYVKSQAIKTWFDMGIFPVDGRASTYGYLVDKTPCLTQVRPKLC